MIAIYMRQFQIHFNNEKSYISNKFHSCHFLSQIWFVCVCVGGGGGGDVRG